jgi:nucleoside-diphosphate-sugar epimerase
MDVLIAGGHGQVARRLIRILAADGHTARGLIRNPDHAADIEADGGTPVLCDLERDELTPHVGGADAIVFAAGAGPGSGAERKRTVDLGAAVKCVEAAEALGVARFVIVSSIGAQDPDAGPEAMRPYLRAKAEADARVRASSLDWTIVRPGSLQNGPGSGRVDVSSALGRSGPVQRDDVALVLAETLQAPNTIRLTFEVFEGDTPAREAVRNLQPTHDV